MINTQLNAAIFLIGSAIGLPQYQVDDATMLAVGSSLGFARHPRIWVPFGLTTKKLRHKFHMYSEYMHDMAAAEIKCQLSTKCMSSNPINLYEQRKAVDVTGMHCFDWQDWQVLCSFDHAPVGSFFIPQPRSAIPKYLQGGEPLVMSWLINHLT